MPHRRREIPWQTLTPCPRKPLENMWQFLFRNATATVFHQDAYAVRLHPIPPILRKPHDAAMMPQNVRPVSSVGRVVIHQQNPPRPIGMPQRSSHLPRYKRKEFLCRHFHRPRNSLRNSLMLYQDSLCFQRITSNGQKNAISYHLFCISTSSSFANFFKSS